MIYEIIDYIISSGIYNLGENELQVQSIFINDYGHFYNSIKIGCAANFLSSFSEKKDNTSIYHNPFSVLEKCQKKISKNVVYIHNYLPHDFTILMYK